MLPVAGCCICRIRFCFDIREKRENLNKKEQNRRTLVRSESLLLILNSFHHWTLERSRSPLAVRAENLVPKWYKKNSVTLFA